MNAPVMTIREIANVLQLTEKTVYVMAHGGELPAFKIRGQWRVRRQDFDIWLSQRTGEPPISAIPTVPATHMSNETIEVDATTVTDAPAPPTPAVHPLEDLTVRVSLAEIHRRFVQALGPSSVRSHSDWDANPFEIDLAHPLPQRVRLYIFNATRPPGGRPLGEHKIQLMVPGQRRGDRGSLNNGDGRIVLMAGYAAEEDVFILWDAGLYPDFAWSRNVQVKAETIIQASAGRLAMQERRLRTPRATETVLAVKPRRLADAIIRRMELTRERLLTE